MAELKEKVELALDEARILVLGAHVLLGAQYQSVFQKGFPLLPGWTQRLHLVGLGLTLLTLGLLMASLPRHLLGDRGAASRGTHDFATRTSSWALLPFAAAMGLAILVAAQAVVGWPAAPWLAGLGCLLAVGAWYGPAALFGKAGRRSREMNEPLDARKAGDGRRGADADPPAEPTDLKTKIQHALIEVRIVLPAAQTMFAFQLFGTLADPFDELPNSSKLVHLASLGCVALSIILLMAPAAFHRLAEGGEMTRRQHRFTAAAVVAAMALLAPGITGDLFVVLRRTLHSTGVAAAVAGGALAVIWAMWFLPALLARRAPGRLAGSGGSGK